MNLSKTTAALAMVALVGVTGACGGNSSSSTASAGAPSDTSKSSFCSTLTGLPQNSTPKQVSDTLGKLGTPNDIASDARHGFEVFVAGLAKLPDKAKASDVTKMEKGLSATDQKDLQSFIAYLGTECASPSSSPSPSN
jgi:hypothetical protein